jgi:hypothetical protein
MLVDRQDMYLLVILLVEMAAVAILLVEELLQVGAP